MTIKNVLSDNRTLRLPFPASTAIAIGDLLFWDSSAHVCNAAANRADKGSLALNQQDFAAIFAGVAADQRLSTETSTTPDSDRLVVTDGIFDCTCASATFEPGDLVGVDRDSGNSKNYSQQVVKVLYPSLAIGEVVQRYSSNTTVVRCRLTSSLFHSDWSKYGNGIGNNQGTGAAVLADAAGVLTIDSKPFQSMVPTAARNVTLPNEAQANSAGLVFYFTNNSAGAFSVTFKASDGATAIRGNGVVPQNKTAILWSDGTNWNGLVSA